MVDNLSKVDQAVNYMTVTAKTTSLQITKDLYIPKLYLYDSLDAMDKNKALSQLNSYCMVNPFVHSIYIYNGHTETFYLATSKSVSNTIQAKADFFDRDAASIATDPASYPKFSPIYRVIPIDQGGSSALIAGVSESPSPVYTFLYYEPGEKGRSNIIFVNISQDWLNYMIGGIHNETGGQTLVLDSEGNLVFGAAVQGEVSLPLDKSVIKDILNSNSSSGYLIRTLGGTKQFLAYSSASQLGWKYLRVTPYELVIKDIERVRNITGAIVFAIIVFGIAAALLLSRMLAKPIQSKMDSMEMELSRNTQKARHDFLRNLLEDWENIDSALVLKRFSELGIDFDAEGLFIVILAKIDGYREFCNRYGYEDRQRCKFSATNMFLEALETAGNAQGVDMGEDQLALILNISAGVQFEDPESLRSIIVQTQESVAKYLDLSVSIAVSPLGHTVKCLNSLYNRTQQASLYRLFAGRGCIILASVTEKWSSNSFTYPAREDQQLVDALMLGNADEAKAHYLSIVGRLAEYPYPVIYMTIYHLIFRINAAIETIEKHNFPDTDTSLNKLVIQLNSVETIGELNSQFTALFDNIAEKLECKKASKQIDLANMITEIIKKEYTNVNLSVNYIADIVQMSPIYVGRLYKRITSKSIVDCISETRLDKACNLLTITNDSVAEIAGKTGFSNSIYFHKAFKTANGITPSEYRRKYARYK